MDFNKIKKYCINLEKRTDRRDTVSKEFKRVGLEVEFWSAIDGSKLSISLTSSKVDEYNAKGILGCLMSHVNLIKHAKETNQEYIVLFEDDIFFCEDFSERIQIIEKQDFDMFYLGGHFGEMGVIPTNDQYIFKAKAVSGTYAYIIRNTIYDYIIDNTSDSWGMDQFYVELAQKRFNCLAFIPFPVCHEDGMSDVAMNNVKYSEVRKYYRDKL